MLVLELVEVMVLVWVQEMTQVLELVLVMVLVMVQ